MRIENLFDSLLQMRMIFIKPISTKDSENKMLIACIARTSSVAFGSMYELQRQILGTKKCQTPNAIVILLATVVRIRISTAYLMIERAPYCVEAISKTLYGKKNSLTQRRENTILSFLCGLATLRDILEMASSVMRR